jgi:RND superfamily putative drug exporter
MIADAVGAAVHTSGRTVIASGLVVIVALGSIAVINGHIFLEIAVAASLVVACCVVAGLTLLPALLALLGPWVGKGALPRRLQPAGIAGGVLVSRSRWSRWAWFILRRPVRLGLLSLLLLGAAATSVVSVNLGLDLGLNSLRDTPAGRGYQIVTDAFSAGSVGPVQVLGCSRTHGLDTAALDGVARLTEALRADRRVASVTSATDLLDRLAGGHTTAAVDRVAADPASRPALARLIDLDRDGRCALVNVVPGVPADSPTANRLLRDLRTELAPRAFAGTDIEVLTGGLTAQYLDLSDETAGKLPRVIVIVLAISFCYLVVVFRSLLVPVKAVLMNLLATAAALGLTVFVFQQGHGAGLIGFTSVGTLQAFLPVTLFALLFGLSMDYEVFLVRRMQEEWLRHRDNDRAVATAIAHTGRQISAAAAIMVAAFGSFLVADVLELQQFGFGLAVAVLIDATVIRLMLVPAFMALTARRNWWVPARLDRLLPALNLE